MDKYSIVIWGVGMRAKRFMDFSYFENCVLRFFVDTTYYGQEYYGYPVKSPKELPDLMENIDYIIVASTYFSEIMEACFEMGIDRKKIIYTDYVAEPIAAQDLNQIKKISSKLYDDVRMRVFIFTNENERDEFDNTKLIGKGKFEKPEYGRDYYRYRTFEFVADEITEKSIPGAVAELGVYRGAFSSLINTKFNKKELYLFDSFEGFDQNEADKEKAEGRSNDEFEYVHKMTNEEIVLSNMPNPELCHICKGFFPNSIPEECKTLQFAFVSIDVDFEDSIYEGLKFFYPRLSEGGAIFVHDYNSQMLDGVRIAVKRFEKDNGLLLHKVPLADRAGTLVIVK